jgi:hypothetical protein
MADQAGWPVHHVQHARACSQQQASAYTQRTLGGLQVDATLSRERLAIRLQAMPLRLRPARKQGLACKTP